MPTLKALAAIPKRKTCSSPCVDDRNRRCGHRGPEPFGGDRVPYGRPGAVLADGTVLGTREFGSVSSEGMLLSAEELGVPEAATSSAFSAFPETLPWAATWSNMFGLDDAILDLSITPNRGDL